MEVVVMRHGPAALRSTALTADQERQRALTEIGRRRVRRAARGLTRLVPRLDAIATSALTRAAETAEIVGQRYANLKPVLLPELEPHGARQGVASWLAAQRLDGTVLLVGHSPDLDELTSWLLAGVSTPFLGFSKGGACLLRIESAPGPASASLLWSLPARALRQLA